MIEHVTTIAWVVIAGGLFFLLAPCFVRDRRDKTGLVLTSLFGGGLVLRGVLFLLYGNDPNEHTKLLAKSLGLATGVVAGIGLSLITHCLVRMTKSPNPPAAGNANPTPEDV